MMNYAESASWLLPVRCCNARSPRVIAILAVAVPCDMSWITKATCWNFLASMLRHIGSRQARLVHFMTAQAGIKHDKSGADPAVTARVAQTSRPDNIK